MSAAGRLYNQQLVMSSLVCIRTRRTPNMQNALEFVLKHNAQTPIESLSCSMDTGRIWQSGIRHQDASIKLPPPSINDFRSLDV